MEALKGSTRLTLVRQVSISLIKTELELVFKSLRYQNGCRYGMKESLDMINFTCMEEFLVNDNAHYFWSFTPHMYCM